MSPGGIALAAGGDDRDGLAMDVLHLRLGPQLAYWPSTLSVVLALQGDVVTDVVVDQGCGLRVPDDVSSERGWGRLSAAARLDSLTNLLVLAGSGPLSARARRTRDKLLDVSVSDADVVAEVGLLEASLVRSRLLRWSLADVAPHSGPGVLEGDVLSRAVRTLRLARSDVERGLSAAPGSRWPTGAASPESATGTVGLEAGAVIDGIADLSDVLVSLLIGLEFASVRLAVASVTGLATSVGDGSEAASDGLRGQGGDHVDRALDHGPKWGGEPS